MTPLRTGAAAGAVEIAEETPLQDEIRALIAELDEAMVAMEPETPREFMFWLTAEEMAVPDMTTFVARQDGIAVGCCALKRHDGGLGEIKRMYVSPTMRGCGVGGLLIEALEAKARVDGMDRLALETGEVNHIAQRVYERAGFLKGERFADYPESPYSCFLHKALSGSKATARSTEPTEATT